MPITVTSPEKIPAILPQEVVQAVALCACCKMGSTSYGYGSGPDDIRGNCCGCGNGFAYPATLTATIRTSCFGDITIPLTKIGDCHTSYNDKVSCCGGDAVALLYYYDFQDVGALHEFFDCASGAFFFDNLGTALNVALYCTYPDATLGDAHVWVLSIGYIHPVSGLSARFNWRVKMNLISCSPMVFAEISSVVTCHPTDVLYCGTNVDASGGADGCCVHKCNTSPSTNHPSIVGCTVVIDVSE